MTLWLWMSGKRNVSVCRGHELANALYITKSKMGNQLLLASTSSHVQLWRGSEKGIQWVPRGKQRLSHNRLNPSYYLCRDHLEFTFMLHFTTYTTCSRSYDGTPWHHFSRVFTLLHGIPKCIPKDGCLPTAVQKGTWKQLKTGCWDIITNVIGDAL